MGRISHRNSEAVLSSIPASSSRICFFPSLPEPSSIDWLIKWTLSKLRWYCLEELIPCHPKDLEPLILSICSASNTKLELLLNQILPFSKSKAISRFSFRPFSISFILRAKRIMFSLVCHFSRWLLAVVSFQGPCFLGAVGSHQLSSRRGWSSYANGSSLDFSFPCIIRYASGPAASPTRQDSGTVDLQYRNNTGSSSCRLCLKKIITIGSWLAPVRRVMDAYMQEVAMYERSVRVARDDSRVRNNFHPLGTLTNYKFVETLFDLQGINFLLSFNCQSS